MGAAVRARGGAPEGPSRVRPGHLGDAGSEHVAGSRKAEGVDPRALRTVVDQQALRGARAGRRCEFRVRAGVQGCEQQHQVHASAVGTTRDGGDGAQHVEKRGQRRRRDDGSEEAPPNTARAGG